MNTYSWVRHYALGQPPITTAVDDASGVYVDDFVFGVRTVVSPLPSVPNVPYTWRHKVYRVGVKLFDLEWRYTLVGGTTQLLEVRSYDTSGVPGGWSDQTFQLSGFPGNTLVLDSLFAAANLGSFTASYLEDTFLGTTTAEYEYRDNGVICEG